MSRLTHLAGRLWSRGAAERALGLALAAAAVWALPQALAAVAHEPDLSVRAPERFLVSATPELARAQLSAGPSGLLPRLEHRGELDRPLGPALAEFGLTYGARWRREVTIPTWIGTLQEPSQPPCAFELRLMPAFFDANRPGAGDLASELERRVRLQFPIRVDSPVEVYLPPARDVNVELNPLDGAVAAQARVLLQDGSRIRVSARLGLERQGAQLVPRLTQVRLLEWSGPSKQRIAGLLGRLGRFFLGDEGFDELVDEQAEPLLRDLLARQLHALELPRAASLFPGRNDDRIGLELCGEPSLERASGLRLPLALRVELAAQVEPKLPGPLQLGLDRGFAPPLDLPSDTGLVLRVTPEGLNQIAWLTWQAGQLELGPESPAVAALRAEVGGRLDFTLERVSPGLPPTWDSHAPDAAELRAAGAWPLRLQAVELGRLRDGRQLLAHADLGVRPVVQAGPSAPGRGDARPDLNLEATLRAVRLVCVRQDGDEQRFSPCLSDVSPLLEEQIEHGDGFSFGFDTGVLRRFSAHSLAGYVLALSAFEARVDPTSGGLELSARTALSPVRP